MNMAFPSGLLQNRCLDYPDLSGWLGIITKEKTSIFLAFDKYSSEPIVKSFISSGLSK